MTPEQFTRADTIRRQLREAESKERRLGLRRVLGEAARLLWELSCGDDDERPSEPCPKCGNRSGDCGC